MPYGNEEDEIVLCDFSGDLVKYPFTPLEDSRRSFVLTFEVTKSTAALLDGILQQLRNYDCNYYRKCLSEGGAKMSDSFSKLEYYVFCWF